MGTVKTPDLQGRNYNQICNLQTSERFQLISNVFGSLLDLLDIQHVVHVDLTAGEPEVLLALAQVVLVLLCGEAD